MGGKSVSWRWSGGGLNECNLSLRDTSRLLWLGEIHGFLVPFFIISEDDIKVYGREVECGGVHHIQHIQ